MNKKELLELENQFIRLDSPRAWRTYTGGYRLDELHRLPNPKVSQFPEEWIMSLVNARNTGREDIVDEGLSHVVDPKYENITLKELINQDPSGFLGQQFYKENGETTGVLVKLIDASERLTVQVHPTKAKAEVLFNSKFGKTECWYILDDKEIDGVKPYLYLGFKKGITREIWKELFDKQDIQGMLSWMHRVEVKKGDMVIIKGGLAHAIGQSCFLVEIQEPTDYTVRIERITPKGLKISDFMCHQGLGFDKMFDVFEYVGYSLEEIKENFFVKPIEKYSGLNEKITTLIGYDTTDLFELEKIDIPSKSSIDIPGSKSFSGLYILKGQGKLISKDSQVDINAPEQYFIPSKLGDWKIENTSESNLEILHFKGPKLHD